MVEQAAAIRSVSARILEILGMLLARIVTISSVFEGKEGSTSLGFPEPTLPDVIGSAVSDGKLSGLMVNVAASSRTKRS